MERAVDRNSLQIDDDDRSGPWGRTNRRLDRIKGVLERRQPSLAVVLEDVHDPHNAAAVLRSCDATGVLDVHLIYVHETPPRRVLHKGTSGSAAKWVRVYYHRSIEACYASLRAEGKRILATALREDTVDLYAQDLTQPVALVFGNEKRGVSDRAVDLADGSIGIPMNGMVESLNISVACAVTLFEAMRQRREAGLFDSPQLDATEMETLSADWVRR